MRARQATKPRGAWVLARMFGGCCQNVMTFEIVVNTAASFQAMRVCSEI